MQLQLMHAHTHKTVYCTYATRAAVQAQLAQKQLASKQVQVCKNAQAVAQAVLNSTHVQRVASIAASVIDEGVFSCF